MPQTPALPDLDLFKLVVLCRYGTELPTTEENP